jgi:hypothetical protein
MFSIKYNRTTNHIAGIAERTVSNQSAENANRYGAVAYYAENACGSLTRYRFADGASFESLAEALEAARKAGGRKLCKTCEKAAEAALAAAEAATVVETEDEGMEFDEGAHVVSVNGGKVHSAMQDGTDSPAYPLCRGGGMNQNLTKFVPTSAPLTCKTCVTYAERRSAKAEANKYEESKQVSEIAAQDPSEPRIKFKVNRILGSSIVTDEDGTKSFRMIVDEAVRGPVGLIFTEDEALWLFADIMDRQKAFREWQAEAGE